MEPLNETVRRYAQDANFAAVTVHLTSGALMTHVMWVDADEHHILLNTEVHRDKWAALQRDPRVTVMVWIREDPYDLSKFAVASSIPRRGRQPRPTSTRSRGNTPGRTT